MQPLTPEQLFEKYELLPRDLKYAISSANTSDTINAIAKKYGLNVDQSGQLADEVGLLMLGVTHPRDFITNLNKRLAVDPETVKKIATEINEQVFSLIRESLKQIHGVGEEKPTDTIPETAYIPKNQTLNTQSQISSPKSTNSSPQTPASYDSKAFRPSPFEQKLKDEAFGQKKRVSETDINPANKTADDALEKNSQEEDKTKELSGELEQAKKENRYPTKADPYKEPPL